VLRPIAIRKAAARRCVATALITAAALLSGAPVAAEPPAPASDAEVSRRLAFIEARLARATPSACLWWSAWYYGYVVVTVGEAGVALVTTNRGLRTDTAVGAAFASLGVLGLGVFAFPPRYAAATLSDLPSGTPAERRRKLARGERLLGDGARAEAGGRSWVAHLAGTAVTLSSSLVLALAYKRPLSGLVTLVSGVGITEAQIFTRPTAAIDDWRAYQQGAWSGSTPATGASPRPWSLIAQPGGMGIAAAF
jgi:hypothetical protein